MDTCRSRRSFFLTAARKHNKTGFPASDANYLPPIHSSVNMYFLRVSVDQGISEDGGRIRPFTYEKIPFPDYSLLVRYDGNAKS